MLVHARSDTHTHAQMAEGAKQLLGVTKKGVTPKPQRKVWHLSLSLSLTLVRDAQRSLVAR